MYGDDPQNLDRVLAKLKELEEVKSELDAKERQLSASERGTTAAILDNTSALQKAIDETRSLATETGVLTEGLGRETQALKANTAAWTEQIALMREAANLGRRMPMATEVSRSSTAAAGRVQRAVEPAVVETSPVAEQRRARGPETIISSPEMQLAGQRLAQAQEAERRIAAPAPLMLSAGSAGTPTIAEAAAAQREQAAAASQAREALAAEAAEARRVAENLDAATASAAKLAAAQREIEITTNQEMASFAGLDSRLSRNGALTTEFIQALARGNVTMEEFGSQMTSTIGKFGGWAIAGAAVYGVADALKQVSEGATQTQEGIQNLSRFIPGVTSGPGRETAEGTFRDISQQMNVPISEVTSAMTIMARVFHNVADAGEATRAVLLASRLDQIPQAQSEQSLIGISTSLGFTRGSQVVGVVNSLNALQNQYGARVSQTLPGIARAAPAAEAGGVSTSMLEALVGTAVRAGVPGAQAGTAILRSIGTFSTRPASEETFRRYGITSEPGRYGELINQLVQRITDPKPGKELSSQDVTQLAQALGGPLLGSRTLLPLLEHAQLIPEMEKTARDPPSATAELDKILGGVGEQAKRLGIELQAIGSELESSGLLTPIQLLLEALGDLGHAVEIAISPFQTIGDVVSSLPGPLKDVLGVVAGAQALKFARGTDFGFATQSALSRLPGLSGLADDQRAAVVGARARLQESILPPLENDAESARRRSAFYGRTVSRAKGSADSATALASQEPSEENAAAMDAANEKLRSTMDTQAQLVEEANAAEQAMLSVQEQIGVLKSSELSYEQRYAYLQEQNMVLMEGVQQSLRDELATRIKSAVTSVASSGGAGVLEGGVLGQERATQALQDASPEVQAAALGATALAENPQSLENLAQSGSLPEAEALAASGGGLRARAAGAVSDAAQGARNRITGIAGSSLSDASDALGRGALPLAIGGGFVGGGLGNLLSTVGVGAFLGDQFGGTVGGALGGAADRVGGALGLGEEGESLGLKERFAEAGESPLLGAGVALAATAAGTGGIGGAIEGAGGGALAGLALTGGNPLGALAGGVAGGALSLVGDLFKSNPNKLNAAGNALRAQISGAGSTLGDQVSFGTSFGAELNTAFDNGNTTQADAAQTEVQKSVRSLAQVLQDSGFGTKTAYSSRASLAAAIGGAITSKGFDKDPGDVGQIIDTASQAIQTRASNYLTYALAQTATNSGALAAGTTAAAQISGGGKLVRATVRAQDVRGDISADEKDVADLRARQQLAEKLAGSTAGSNNTKFGGNVAFDPKGVAAVSAELASAKGQLTQDKQVLSQTNDQLKGLRDRNVQAIQGLMADVLQQTQENISSVTSLAQASTGNKTAQAASGVSGAVAALQAVRNQKGLSPEARRQAMEAAQTSVYSAQETAAQTAAQELQARLSVTASKVPDYQPVTQARVALNNAKEYYEHVKKAMLPDGKPAFDAADVNNALAAQNAAVIALNDANYTYQSQIASDTAAIASAKNPAYAYGQAQSQVSLGQTQLKLARNPDERLQAQAQILQGQNSAKEALQATAQGTYQVAEAQEGGDSVAQAMTEVAAANKALAMSMGPDQTLAAEQQLAQAQQTLHQALQQQIVAQGALRASQTNNTLQQDADNLAATEKALAQAIKGGYGKTVVTADATAVGQARLQTFNDRFSQQVSTISFLQDTLQLSAQGALAQLEKLQQEKGLSVSERQQLAEAAYQIETNQDNTSLFDLAPSGGTSPKLPTIYDVRNSARREMERLRGRGDIGGMHDHAGKVTIGGAQVDTTGGAIQVHDTTTHSKLDLIASRLLASTGGVTSMAGSGVVDTMNRTTRRVRASAQSAGLRGT